MDTKSHMVLSSVEYPNNTKCNICLVSAPEGPCPRLPHWLQGSFGVGMKCPHTAPFLLQFRTTQDVNKFVGYSRGCLDVLRMVK